MARAPKEWVGKTDNHMPPATVRQRILDREKSTCHICGGVIDRPGWHADHVPPLKDGGENRESMIKPAHDKCHRKLTAEQAIERAPVERKKLKHTGAARSKQSIQSRGFDKKPRTPKQTLPPAPLYKDASA